MIHAYGHGKYEDISGLIEAILIIIAGLIIIYEATNKLFHPHEFESSLLLLGIAVMGISAVTNIIVSHRLMEVAKETDSIALEGDAWHLRTDVYTSVGVMVGLIIVYITGITFLDPLIAIFVALIILKAGFSLTKRSYNDLIDCSLSEEDRKKIEEIVLLYKDEFVNMHHLRTRRAGPEVFIEFHIAVEADMAVHDAHALLDLIEEALVKTYSRAIVTIHLEACEKNCLKCTAKCEDRHFTSANDDQS
jgi:cation diffusion facilitator family transporter